MVNRYTVKWHNKTQPINGITYQCAQQYIIQSVNLGSKLQEFTLFDNWGQLKVEIVLTDIDPTLNSNYITLFN